jgi:hypothetical protein
MNHGLTIPRYSVLPQKAAEESTLLGNCKDFNSDGIWALLDAIVDVYHPSYLISLPVQIMYPTIVNHHHSLAK